MAIDQKDMFLMEIGLSTFQFRFTTEYHLLSAASVLNTVPMLIASSSCAAASWSPSRSPGSRAEFAPADRQALRSVARWKTKSPRSTRPSARRQITMPSVLK